MPRIKIDHSTPDKLQSRDGLTSWRPSCISIYTHGSDTPMMIRLPPIAPPPRPLTSRAQGSITARGLDRGANLLSASSTLRLTP
jgi:hypothetical protein